MANMRKLSQIVRLTFTTGQGFGGVVVITSALHAEGPQFDPGRDQIFFSRPFFLPLR